MSTVIAIDSDVGCLGSLKELFTSVSLRFIGFELPSDFFKAYESGALDHTPPRVLLVDLRLPEMSGLHVIEKLNRLTLPPPTILVSAHVTVEDTVQAMRLGAYSALQKPCVGQALLNACQAAIKEDVCRRRKLEETLPTFKKISDLTPREKEVLDLVLAGKASREVAQVLGISPSTVDNHRMRIMEKTGVSSMFELARVLVHYNPPV